MVERLTCASLVENCGDPDMKAWRSMERWERNEIRTYFGNLIRARTDTYPDFEAPEALPERRADGGADS